MHNKINNYAYENITRSHVVFFGYTNISKNSRTKKIIKKISKRSSTRNDKSIKQISQLSEALQFFSSYKATIIAPSQTNVGETYIMNGYYYPSSRLFIPSNDNIYTYKVRKYFIPYLFPKAIMYRKSSNFKN